MRALFIGGEFDGRSTEVARGERNVTVPTKAGDLREGRYRRESIAAGGKVFEVFVHDRITLAEAIEKLITSYGDSR